MRPAGRPLDVRARTGTPAGALLAGLGAVVFDVAPDGRAHLLDAPPARPLGFAQAAWAEAGFLERAAHAEDRAAVLAARRRAAAGENVTHAYRVVLSEGEVRHVEESVGPGEEPGAARAVALDVTRWRRLEERLRTYRAVFEKSNDGIAIIGPDGRYLSQNAAHRALIGYSDEELAEATPAIHFGEATFAAIAEALERDGVWRGEAESRARDGRLLAVDLAAFTLRDDDGRVLCHVGIKRDVTRRKENERRIRFQARLLDLVGEAVIATDLEGRITYWNRGAERLFGWPADEVTGRDLLDVTPTEMSREQAQALMARLRRGESWSGEFPMRRRDGSTFLGLVTDAPVRDEDGRVVGIVGVSTDISARSRIEEGLRHRVRELAAIYRLVDTVAQADRDDDIHGAALDAVEAALGARRAAILVLDHGGMRFRAWRRLSDRYRSAVEGHSPWAPDAKEFSAVLVADAREDPALAALRPVLEAEGVRALAFIPLTWQGRLLGKFMIYHDEPHAFTEDEVQLARTIASHVAFGLARRRDAEELETARRQVAASEKLAALGSLVSGVAHEVRTPLTFISNNLHLARRRLDADRGGEVAEHLDAALEGVERINRLVTDLRPFARLRGGRERAGLHDVVAGAVSLFRATHRGQVVVDAQLSPTPPLDLDREQVQQIVLNLLENASEANPGGRVRLRVVPVEAGAEIVVEDDGPGIPAAVVGRIFDPFFTTKAEGTGLGLSIVRRIVEAHNGTVRVESHDGGGARFTVFLPR